MPLTYFHIFHIFTPEQHAIGLEAAAFVLPVTQDTFSTKIFFTNITPVIATPPTYACFSLVYPEDGFSATLTPFFVAAAFCRLSIHYWPLILKIFSIEYRWPAGYALPPPRHYAFIFFFFFWFQSPPFSATPVAVTLAIFHRFHRLSPLPPLILVVAATRATTFSLILRTCLPEYHMPRACRRHAEAPSPPLFLLLFDSTTYYAVELFFSSGFFSLFRGLPELEKSFLLPELFLCSHMLGLGYCQHAITAMPVIIIILE